MGLIFQRVCLCVGDDKIYLMDVLEHAFEPNALMQSTYDSLNDGGTLIMQVSSTGGLSELAFGKYHLGHLRYYNEKYLTNHLIKNILRVEYITTYNSVSFSSFF